MTSTSQPVSISETIVPEEIRTILLSRATLARARTGQHVVAVGLPSNDVFLILEGRVSVSLMSAQGRETMIRTVGPNQIVGELAALDGAARSADVIATEPLQLAVIRGSAFVELAETHAALGLWLARHLTRQVRFLTDRVYELSNLAVGSRLQCELLRLAIEQGISGDSAVIGNPPTQSELASRIGTNRETITREMKLLVQHGLVRKSGRQIEIPSLHRLGMKVRDLSAAG